MRNVTATKLPLSTLMERGGYKTANDLGRVLGLSRASIQRAKHEGVPIMRADTFALACGFHPIEVWGDLYYQALDQVDADAGVTLLTP